MLLLAPTDLDAEGQKDLAQFFEVTLIDEITEIRPLYKGQPLVKVHLMTTVRANDNRDIDVRFLDSISDPKLVSAVEQTMRRAHAHCGGQYVFTMSPPQGGKVVFA